MNKELLVIIGKDNMIYFEWGRERYMLYRKTYYLNGEGKTREIYYLPSQDYSATNDDFKVIAKKYEAYELYTDGDLIRELINTHDWSLGNLVEKQRAALESIEACVKLSIEQLDKFGEASNIEDLKKEIKKVCEMEKFLVDVRKQARKRIANARA